MKKNSKSSRKNNVVLRKKVNNNNVNVAEVNATRHSFVDVADYFNNEVVSKVVTVDMSRLSEIDYMSMSRVAFFRIAVKKDYSFNQLVQVDYKFYRDTNDRSKSRKQDKKDDLLAYSKQRCAKQLRDVLKEKSIVTYLNSKYNTNYLYFTVAQYKQLVK